MGVNTLLNIGNSALFGTQVAINVTGNNIANVNTDGYSRQSVRFEEYSPINMRPGQLGMGSYAAEVYRNFNQFVEKSYLDRSSQFSRWQEQSFVLQGAESLFNESNRVGLNSSMGIFFQDWQNLSQRPNDSASREALLSDADNLAKMFRDTQKSLDTMQNELNLSIDQTVSDVNQLLDGLRQINRQIASTQNPGINNANSLYDSRDKMLRQLAEYVDIDIIDRGSNNIAVQTKSGMPLLDGDAIYTLETRDLRIENRLTAGSTYTGNIKVSGSDSHEYTLEMVNGGKADDVPPPSFRVSLDGGRTWLRNDDGTEMRIDVEAGTPPGGETRTVKVKDLEISFTSGTDFSSGDRFEIIPKKGLYWVSPTRDPLNITPQVLSDGSDNPNRLTGGKLASYFNVRDQNVGRYMDKMDALANAMIWEVNKAHSQGAGTKMLASTTGSYGVRENDQPLGHSSTGLPFASRLTAGNVNFTMYGPDGKPIDGGHTMSLDFDPAVAGTQNFDPTVHSLQDVADAINRLEFGTPPTANMMQATIVEGKLVLNAAAGNTFALSSDTAGLMAGLGINTFFSGTNATDMGIKSDIMQDSGYINAGSVNADGSVAAGDASIALALAKLATTGVKISTSWENSTQSLVGYHASLVSMVGADSRTARFNSDYNKTLANELDERSSAISGVNIDEEMSNLIKFQHSYTAAAKLITTADQMLQTLLSMKQ